MDPNIIAIFAVVVAFIGVIVGVINTFKITTIHVMMNSRMDELLKMTEIRGFEAGLKERNNSTS